MVTLKQDLRYGIRVLVKNPAFSLVAVLTMALGIGANTAIFSIVDGVLLTPLPFKEPDRLVFIQESSLEHPTMSVAYPNFLDWRERSRSFSHMAAHRSEDYNLTGRERPRKIEAIQASADLFPMLGVSPALGRAFDESDDRAGAAPVVVLSGAFWKSSLGGDPKIVGQSLNLDGRAFQVIGVMPAGFVYPLYRREVDLWTPIGPFAGEVEWMMNRGNHPGMRVTARLKAPASIERSGAELGEIAATLAKEYPESNSGQGIRMVSLASRTTRNIRPALLVLSAAVALVLLIACVNVANLQLARAAVRGQEIAIRSALGAGKIRIVRQLLTESVLLSVAGGTVGLLLAYGSIRFLVSTLPPESLPAYASLGIDTRVLAFTFLVAVVAGIAFGLAPAFQSSRRAGRRDLRDGVRATGGLAPKRLKNALVVAETALALVLLLGAALYLQSFERLTSTDPGFEADNVLTFELTLPESTYPEKDQQAAFFRRLVTRIQALPSVVSAAHSMPLLGGWQSGISVEGQPARKAAELPSSEMLRVSPEIFETLGLRILRGRPLSEQDRKDSARVAVVDETFAERFWPSREALGRRFMIGSPDDPLPEGATAEERWIEIVGIVNHIKSYGVDQDSRIQAYLPSPQSQYPFTDFVVRTSSDPLALTSLIEREVLALDNDQPISKFETLESMMGRRVVPQRLSARLLGVFAGLALLLASIGIYGVMAYSVTQRRKELGIRMALGAQSKSVLGLVIAQGLRLALLGIAIGVGLALLASPLVAGQLFNISATDPVTFVLIGFVLTLVAGLACTLPALRASRLNPVVALRFQ